MIKNILAGAIALALVGCGQETAVTPPAPESAATSQAQKAINGKLPRNS